MTEATVPQVLRILNDSTKDENTKDAAAKAWSDAHAAETTALIMEQAGEESWTDVANDFAEELKIMKEAGIQPNILKIEFKRKEKAAKEAKEEAAEKKKHDKEQQTTIKNKKLFNGSAEASSIRQDLLKKCNLESITPEGMNGLRETLTGGALDQAKFEEVKEKYSKPWTLDELQVHVLYCLASNGMLAPRTRWNTSPSYIQQVLHYDRSKLELLSEDELVALGSCVGAPFHSRTRHVEVNLWNSSAALVSSSSFSAAVSACSVFDASGSRSDSSSWSSSAKCATAVCRDALGFAEIDFPPPMYEMLIRHGVLTLHQNFLNHRDEIVRSLNTREGQKLRESTVSLLLPRTGLIGTSREQTGKFQMEQHESASAMYQRIEASASWAGFGGSAESTTSGGSASSSNRGRLVQEAEFRGLREPTVVHQKRMMPIHELSLIQNLSPELFPVLGMSKYFASLKVFEVMEKHWPYVQQHLASTKGQLICDRVKSLATFAQQPPAVHFDIPKRGLAAVIHAEEVKKTVVRLMAQRWAPVVQKCRQILKETSSEIQIRELFSFLPSFEIPPAFHEIPREVAAACQAWLLL